MQASKAYRNPRTATVRAKARSARRAQ
jgi:hypothetical protein